MLHLKAVSWKVLRYRGVYRSHMSPVGLQWATKGKEVLALWAFTSGSGGPVVALRQALLMPSGPCHAALSEKIGTGGT